MTPKRSVGNCLQLSGICLEDWHDHTVLPHRWNVIPREAEIEEVQQC